MNYLMIGLMQMHGGALLRAATSYWTELFSTPPKE